MTPRSIRRAAERAVQKQARKAAKLDTLQPVAAAGVAPGSAGPTGPRSPEGKAVSCLNNLKHGLAGVFRVMPEFESQTEFDSLRTALDEEHQPHTPTEMLLVDRMAQHIWLSQRAQRLQDVALGQDDPQRFALYLRYQTTNDRAFHKCLAELRAVRREAAEFESQNEKRAAQTRLANAKAESIEWKKELESTIEAPIPGRERMPLVEAKEIFETAFRIGHERAALLAGSSNR